MITKIISGGQTGADRGGLEAGKELGIKTGGTAPPEFMTEKGPDITLKLFGLVEGEEDPSIYPKRTRKNVYDSDGTVWFGDQFSPGGRLTIGAARSLNRPRIINPTIIELKRWIRKHNISILNVAGNRESRNRGIAEVTKTVLIKAIGGTIK